MFWVLEQNLYNEDNFKNLVTAIERQGSEYIIVKRVPIFNILVDDDGNEIDVTVPPDSKVYVCGSGGMGVVAKQHGWFPGYFDENLDYELTMKRFGEYCLNHHGYVTTLRNPFMASDSETMDKMLCLISQGTFFARPAADGKTFAGTIFDLDDFNEWRQKVIDLESDQGDNSMTTLKPDDKIILAPLTTIYQEFRFFVVDETVVTGSMYKLGNKVLYSADVPERVTAFAQKMAYRWSPNRAYCLDIAVVEEGELGDMKVIEINALNSAGFYACDMNKYVAAINAMEFDNCHKCRGMKGGVPGNGNIIDGKVTCDYCS